MSAVCSSVDQCLQLGRVLSDQLVSGERIFFLGLRRRSLGLFKTSSSSALLNKISKECEEALHIIRRWRLSIKFHYVDIFIFRLDELEKQNKSASLSQNSTTVSGNESSRSFTFKSSSSVSVIESNEIQIIFRHLSA